MGFQNSATGPDLGFYAARSYSLMRPPRTGRRLICFWLRSATADDTGWSGRGGWRCRLRWGGVRCGAMGLILGQDGPQVPRAEDEHPVGDLGPGCEHEPFRVSVRARAAWRDLHRLDTGIGQDCVKRRGELPGAVPYQEPEVGGAITQIHQEVADLLCGPRPVRVRRDPEDVHKTAAYLDDEQAVQPLQGHRAVDVEEVGGTHRRCLGVQELPPRGAGAPLRCRGDLRALRTRRMVDALTRWPSLSSSPWNLVSPAVVLGGEPRDQRCDLGADWRPSCLVGVGPRPSDQAAVPAQDGAGGDQTVPPQPGRQEPDQRGEDCAVCPVEPGPRIVRAENVIRGCDQQRCPPCRPAVMITGHVPAVRLPPAHADDLMVAAVPA